MKKDALNKRLRRINKDLERLESAPSKQHRFSIKNLYSKEVKPHKTFIFGLILMLILGALFLISTETGIVGYFILESTDSGENHLQIDKEILERFEWADEVDVIAVLQENNSALETSFTLMVEKTNEFMISSEYDYWDLQKFEKLNLISMKITKGGLEKLKNNTFIKTVVYDKTFSVSLQDSVPQINANRTWLREEIKEGTSVCLIDTGVDLDHPELNNSLIGGYDFVNDDAIAQDDNNHGTHLAGIIHRIAPKSRIVPVKVCNANGGCKGSNILSGLNYCLENKNIYNITVISGSLGDGGEYNEDNCPVYFGGAFEIIDQNNITSVFSSGNNGYQNGINYPACLREVISAGAVNKQDVIPLFSNRGSALDLLAPGVDINSTIIDSYGILSGTSMSAPHVGAAVNALKSVNNSLNTNDIRIVLQDTGVIVDTFFRIDLLAAVDNISPVLMNETIPNSTLPQNETNTTPENSTYTPINATEPPTSNETNNTIPPQNNETIPTNETQPPENNETIPTNETQPPENNETIPEISPPEQETPQPALVPSPSSGSNSASNYAPPTGATTASSPETPNLQEQLKDMLNTFEKKETQTSIIEDAEEPEEAGQNEKSLISTPAGHLLKESSVLYANIDVLLIITLFITIVLGITYLRFYRRLDWPGIRLRRNNNKKKGYFPKKKAGNSKHNKIKQTQRLSIKRCKNAINIFRNKLHGSDQRKECSRSLP